MNKQALYIYDDRVLDKLEFFIYDYSDWEYNNFEVNKNYYLCGNKSDRDKVKNKDNIYQLRELLSYHKSETCLRKDEIENSIDLFLLYLRTHNIEASMCLNSLLDAIWQVGPNGREWQCVKRLNGILASIYLLYFSEKAKLFNKEETERNMKDLFQRNIEFYTQEDKNFLIDLFWVEKEFDCLVDLLGSYMEISGKEEKYTDESAYRMWNKFIVVLRKLRNARRYEDALILIKKSNYLFIQLNDVMKWWYEREKAKTLFYIGKYEEARNIFDNHIGETDGFKLAYDLYDNALCCAWTAENKEKDDPKWRENIDNALRLIKEAIGIVSTPKKVEEWQFVYQLLFEQAYLLSENGQVEESYNCFNEAFSNADTETKRESNFSTHLWILMKYMCRPDVEQNKILETINGFYNDFCHKRLREYEDIVDFANTNEYLNENTELRDEIYAALLKLQFRASEIMHATKIRDTTEYNILYYTKAEHLRLMLEDETDGNSHYRLPIFHAYHMNDPQEGKILQKLLQEDVTDTLDMQNIYEENYVFLKSFFCFKNDTSSLMKERLPMWVQYGDDAKGCCILLNSKTFEKSKLRKIVYISDDGKCSDTNMQEFLDNFIFAYEELRNLCKRSEFDSEQGQECLKKIRSLTGSIIASISHLFKHDTYKHEEEARLIVNRKNSDLDDVKVIPGMLPKIYIYNDKQTYIDEVILGSKMENPEDHVPFIYKQGNKMWKEHEMKNIKVSHSMIQYR